METINPAVLTGPTNGGENLVDIKNVGGNLPTGFWRALSLDFLSVASALFFGYAYFLYLTGGTSPWFAVGGLTAFAVFSALQVFLAVSIGRRTLIILAETILMIAAFAFYDAIDVVLIAGAVVFILLFWGFASGRGEVSNQVEIHFWKATSGVVGKVASAAVLFLLIVYAPQAQGGGIFVPRSSFRTFFDWSSGVLNGMYPGINFNDSFGSFAKQFAKQELSQNPSFAALPQTEQDTAVSQAASSLSATVKQSTGVAPTLDEPVSDVAYDYIVAALRGWQEKFSSQFLVVWVVVLFLLYRTIAFVYVWAAQVAALVVYEILIAAKFMHVEGIPETKETLRY